MKLKRIKFPSSGYQSPLLSYWLVVVFVTLLIIYKLSLHGLGCLETDSMQYYNAGDLLASGTVDDFRTPVYPIILHIFKMLFGFEGSRIAVTIFQIIIFVLSIVYVNKSLKLIVPQSFRLHYWLTLFYILLQYSKLPFGFESASSDALAVYCSVFLTYCIIRSAQIEASYRYAVWTSVWLLLLVFLRPVLLCYIPVVIFFWILLCWKFHRNMLKKCLIGMGGIVVIVALLGAYYYEVNRKYNIHSITIVGSINNYCMLRSGGIITFEDIDPELKKYFEEQAKQLTDPEQRNELHLLLISPYSLHPVIERFVNQTIKSNLKVVVQTIIKRFRNTYTYTYAHFIDISILFTFCVLLVYSFVYQQIPIIPWTLLLFVISLWVSIFVGAMAEWHRLSSPMTSMFVLMLGWAFSKVRLAP